MDERSGLSVFVTLVIVVFFVEVALVDLPANFARRQRCRVDIGVGGIGGKRIREGVEVTGHHILARDRLDARGH